MKVLKFGGSSISSPERITNVIEILKATEKQEHAAVVFSAFGGITDKLIETSKLAASGRKEYLEILNKVEEHHFNSAKSLTSSNSEHNTYAILTSKFKNLRDILHGVFLVKELTPRSMDLIMSFGERLSAFIICESLKVQNLDAEYLNASKLIKTDDHFGNARVNLETTNHKIKDYFDTHGSLQCITGFIGSTENNEITTLGRGGSDYTAAIIGAALQVSVIEIWTDVNGVMTADPKMVANAFPIESMTYEEAMEMSHFGSKVIHPKVMQPALEKKIPIRIKNSFSPEFDGTLVCDKPAENASIIRGISSISDLALVRVQGSGMIGVTGISARLFSALAMEKINVILITQASSEHSICLAVDPNAAYRAKKVIEEEFSLEILAHHIEEVAIEEHQSVIAVVGERMRGTPGIAARTFHTLGENGINVVAVAQGSSELNISIVVNNRDEAAALNAIHEAFFIKGKKSLRLFLVGVGLVGSKLLQQIQGQSQFLERKYALDIKINAMANSKKMIFDSKGIAFSHWQDRLDHSPNTMNMEEFVVRMKNFNFRNSVFVDCTASESIVKYYERILDMGVSIVTPNKKANSSSFEQYKKLKSLAFKRGIKYLYETNVGASLPIISTLNDLILCGDKISRIETIISGTISFILNSFDGSKKFSEIVREAKEKGYTEPDPREDLNGLDVARKLLILAREMGLECEARDISVENILPEPCRKADSVDEFFLRLQNEDAYFEKMRGEAENDGKVLRYIATIEKGKAKVSMQAVNKRHPFYYLEGNENIIAITTQRYKEKPIVIKGPGAGADLTAAGVFADIIRIGNS